MITLMRCTSVLFFLCCAVVTSTAHADEFTGLYTEAKLVAKTCLVALKTKDSDFPVLKKHGYKKKGSGNISYTKKLKRLGLYRPSVRMGLLKAKKKRQRICEILIGPVKSLFFPLNYPIFYKNIATIVKNELAKQGFKYTHKKGAYQYYTSKNMSVRVSSRDTSSVYVFTIQEVK